MYFGRRLLLSTHTVIRQLTLRFPDAMHFYDSLAVLAPRPKASTATMIRWLSKPDLDGEQSALAHQSGKIKGRKPFRQRPSPRQMSSCEIAHKGAYKQDE